ncbi:nitrate/nitrite transporter NrtS [Vibrio hepatarius]|uniref:nitrate/nitrite transporter NrtS n=1 Tax=Vibrio hepatarius TaxID=171383 RepID=UPI001C083E3B|nr:nitrate/nitrite transporter NrtS [Vibrio hepatarius]MBU2895514.1 nitrate/nitrite transporter NrtS [Vibrio hepatarius]
MNRQIIKRAILIAIVVGTLLNIINQYDSFVGDSSFNWLKAILTYCVPCCVSLFSSWLAVRDTKDNGQ